MIMKNLKRVFLLMLITAVMLCAAAPAYAANNFEVSGTQFDTFDAAVAHVKANNGGNISAFADITLTSNVALPAGSKIIVASNMTLNTNGFTLSGIDNSSKNSGLIETLPGMSLTVSGSGTLSYSATVDKGWSALSAVISNDRGHVTVNGATIQHLGGTSMAYGIDNRTNGDGTTATTTVKSGYVGSAYIAIRQFANGAGDAKNAVTVDGGTVDGAKYGIWIQNPNSNANDAELNVVAGSVDNVLVYFEGALDAKVSIAAGAVGVVEADSVPAGKILANVNGTYKLYDSVQDAFNEAGANGSVSLTHAVTLTSDVNVPNGVTVNLNGNNMSGANLVVPNGGSVKLTDSVGGGSASVNGNNVSGGNSVNVGADGVASIVPTPVNPNPGTNPNPAPAAPAVENIYYVPATDDNSNMALWSILALALLTTAFVTRKKKAEN